MPIYSEQFENILLKWLSFFLMKKPKDATGAYSYKVLQKITRKKFMKDIVELFNTLSQSDIEIVEKKGVKNIFIKSKL